MHYILNHLFIWTGTKGSGSIYGFWSGFGSDIGEVAILGGVVQLARKHNCHTKGCWRVSQHETPAGYKLCKVCIAKPLAPAKLHDIHPDHAATVPGDGSVQA